MRELSHHTSGELKRVSQTPGHSLAICHPCGDKQLQSLSKYFFKFYFIPVCQLLNSLQQQSRGLQVLGGAPPSTNAVLMNAAFGTGERSSYTSWLAR